MKFQYDFSVPFIKTIIVSCKNNGLTNGLLGKGEELVGKYSLG